MLYAIAVRIGQSIGVAFAMTVIVFAGVNLIGNPVYLLVAPDASQAEIERVIVMLGLDRPVIEQYWLFLRSLLTGTLGNSFVSGQPALQLIVSRFPATLELALSAIVLAIVIGIPLGVLAGYYYERRFAKAIMAGSIFGFSLPNFWIGLILIMVFAVQLGLLPSGGRGPTAEVFGIRSSLFTLDGLRHIILPALTLAMFKISLAIRLAAAGTREVMHLDYIKYARAKGLGEWRIVSVHIAKNILIPVVTVMGMEFAQLLAFSLVTETVFNWPGMGKLFIDAIRFLDRPVIVAYMVFILGLFILMNLIVDLLYTVLDPRIRLAAAHN